MTYDSPQAAQREVKRLKRCRRSLDGKIHGYRCTICKKWHVGQVPNELKTPRKKKRKRARWTS